MCEVGFPLSLTFPSPWQSADRGKSITCAISWARWNQALPLPTFSGDQAWAIICPIPLWPAVLSGGWLVQGQQVSKQFPDPNPYQPSKLRVRFQRCWDQKKRGPVFSSFFWHHGSYKEQSGLVGHLGSLVPTGLVFIAVTSESSSLTVQASGSNLGSIYINCPEIQKAWIGGYYVFPL